LVTLPPLIRKKENGKPANANPAKVANDEPATTPSLAGLAALALAKPIAAPLSAADDAAIRTWLAHIDETDPATIADVLDKYRADSGERQIVLRWADEVPRPATCYDDRRRCDYCANLTGRGTCLAAWRGQIVASRNVEPIQIGSFG
jgi:hypothetical protein